MSRKATKSTKENHQEINPESNNIEQQNADNEISDQDITSDSDDNNSEEPSVNSVEAFEELSAKTEEAENKAREWQDKYIRLSAEFDN